MKKLLIVFVVGALFASCSSTLDKEASAEFCECVNVEEVVETTNVMELMEITDKRTACIKKWQAKYNGKVSTGFKDILKESCPDGYSQAEEMGMFESK